MTTCKKLNSVIIAITISTCIVIMTSLTALLTVYWRGDASLIDILRNGTIDIVNHIKGIGMEKN